MTRRSKNEGSIFFDAARQCWVGQVDLGTDPETGQRRRPKVSAPTKTECSDKLSALRAEKRVTGTVAPRNTTVEHVVRDWMTNLPPEIKSPISVKLATANGERIIASIGTVKLAKLTPAQVERFLRQMAADGYSTSVISATRRVLVRAIRRAERDGLVSRNVAALADCPAGTLRRSRSMTVAQAQQLLRADLGTWWHAYMTAAIESGLRPGEITGLAWEDVDFDEHVIRVRHSLKTGPDGGLVLEDLKTETSKRTVGMPKATMAALKALRTQQREDRIRLGAAYGGLGTVFCNRAGKPVCRQVIHRQFRAATERAGIGRNWQPRETRHTNISVLSDAGVDIEDISAAAGHKNSQITKTTYRHVIADKLTRTADAMDQIGLAGA